MRKETLAEDLQDQLSVLQLRGNRVADEWKKKYRPEWTKETTPVLHFTVSTGARKFGNDANRVETMVIHIKSMEVDAMYLKLLFATAYETGDLAGIFIPNGYHLTHGVESNKQLLRHQNAYLKDIGVIGVEGITQVALTQCITVKGEETTLMSYLMTSELGLESIEETNHMEEHGKWFF
eukprot:7995822-Ditylum_brightwellii.AAC.1